MLVAGWLKKKAQSKAMVANKYQRRWFELTADTLAYAKDPQELKESNIEVFGIHELQWLKRIDDIKLEMKFPERVLRIAAETPGQADKWFMALDRLLRERQLQEQQPEQAPIPRGDSFLAPQESLKRNQVITAFTIEAESDEDDIPPPQTAHARQTANRSSQPVRGRPGHALPRTLSPPRQEPFNVQDRPPSPRSLLANPRMGSLMIAHPTPTQPSEDGQLYNGSSHEDDLGEPDSHTAIVDRFDSPVRSRPSSSHTQGPASYASSVPMNVPPVSTTPDVPRFKPLTAKVRDEYSPTLHSAGTSPNSTLTVSTRVSQLEAARSGLLPTDDPNSSPTPAARRGRPPVAPARSQEKSEVLTLDAAPTSAAPQAGGRAAGSASGMSQQGHGSRPGSGASSRFSAERGYIGAASRAPQPGDERLELQPPVAATLNNSLPTRLPPGQQAPLQHPVRGHSAGARAGSAGSAGRAPGSSLLHHGGVGQGLQVQGSHLTGSSVGPGPSALTGSEHDENFVEDDWDSSEGEAEAASRSAHPQQLQGRGQPAADADSAMGRAVPRAQRAQPLPASDREVSAYRQPQAAADDGYAGGQARHRVARAVEQAPAAGKAGWAAGPGMRHENARLEDSDEMQAGVQPGMSGGGKANGHAGLYDGVQHGAGVVVDTNFAEENWDSDDE